jgi:FAD:protein FMN transferase
MAIELNRESSGAFDMTVAPLLQQHGLLPRGVCDPTLATAPTVAAGAVELLGHRRIRYRHPGITIDLGGIAKGFAVDRALDVLRGRGLVRGLVNAGGDLAAFGPEPELVHIRHPTNAGRVLGWAAITNAALASSGRTFDLLQFAEAGECAVFDPTMQAPVRNIVGATVHAPCCMIADALTKVVMIAGDRHPRLDWTAQFAREGKLAVERLCPRALGAVSSTGGACVFSCMSTAAGRSGYEHALPRAPFCSH